MAKAINSESNRAMPLGASLHSKYSDSTTLPNGGMADLKSSVISGANSRCSTPSSDVSNVFTTAPSSVSWSTATSQEMETSESFEMRVQNIDLCGNEDDGPSPKAISDSSSMGGLSPQLRQEMSLQKPSPLRRAASPASSEGSEEQDSESSEGKGNNQEEEDDEDSDWSGEDSTLESTVIAAVDGDLGLAAYLIPLIHKDLHSGVRNKVESWQNTAASGSGSSSSAQDSSNYSVSPSNSPSNPRKRRRAGSGNQDSRGDGKEGEGDDGGASNERGNNQLPADAQAVRLLACPFHKSDPAKYCQHSILGPAKAHNFRACAGPGFKNIQRLKEHLKRKHSPVQCDRCYEVFQGSDRPTCVDQLLKHRQADTPCERKSPVLKEGISEAQWAALDKQNRKRNQETHRVAKWFAIWAILFPNESAPLTPWYDSFVPEQNLISSTGSRDAFGKMFLAVLDHKLRSGDIALPEKDMADTREKLKNAVLQAFTLYTSIGGPMSPTDTSSSLTGTNPYSAVGGSSTHMTQPTNSSSQQLSATTVSTMPSSSGQPYGLNIANPSNTPGYAIVPMARRHSQFQSPMPTQLSPAPAMPAQVPMGGFTAMPQQDLNNYCYVFGQNWAGNSQFQTMPTIFPGSGQMNVGEQDFFSQSQGFRQGPQEDEFRMQ